MIKKKIQLHLLFRLITIDLSMKFYYDYINFQYSLVNIAYMVIKHFFIEITKIKIKQTPKYRIFFKKNEKNTSN